VADEPSSQTVQYFHLRSPAYFAGAGLFVMLLLGVTVGCPVTAWMYVAVPNLPVLALAVGGVFGVLASLAWGGWMWPRKLALGADGVLVGSAWRTWLIPFESIAHARFDGGVWCLTVSRGRELRFPTDWSPKEQSAVMRSFDEARAAHASSQRQPADLRAWLDRAGRTTADWVRGLRQLLSQAAPGYRSAQPDREALREVLMRGTEPAHVRVAAAIALAAEGGDDRQHVRVASEKTVQPELQEAFRIVAMDGEDQGVERTLERMEQAKR
jgi:hypothetical protein